MTTKEIIELDYYSNNNDKIFQKCLKKIKPFENEEEINLELLEKYVGLVCRKYDFQIDYINPMYIKGEKRNLYSCNVRNSRRADIAEIYACSIYELFVKLSILFYSESKKVTK